MPPAGALEGQMEKSLLKKAKVGEQKIKKKYSWEHKVCCHVERQK